MIAHTPFPPLTLAGDPNARFAPYVGPSQGILLFEYLKWDQKKSFYSEGPDNCNKKAKPEKKVFFGEGTKKKSFGTSKKLIPYKILSITDVLYNIYFLYLALFSSCVWFY